MSDSSAPDRQAAHIQVGVAVVVDAPVAGSDFITVEEPLEIRVVFGPADNRSEMSLSVTMRTPGNDVELVLGFLIGEAIIADPTDVDSIEPWGTPSLDKGLINIIRVELAADTLFDAERLSRYTYTSSSCGVCGKASLDAVRLAIPSRAASPFSISTDRLQALPEALHAGQAEFARTGGLHASALFDSGGNILRIREDVGRHNALDKLIGSCFQADLKTLNSHGLMLSGRTSFELVQKAAMVGIPLIAAIGPPSSLALELAEAHDITLVGFLRADRFNLYCGSIT